MVYPAKVSPLANGIPGSYRRYRPLALLRFFSWWRPACRKGARDT
jgi:hypothetical protein